MPDFSPQSDAEFDALMLTLMKAKLDLITRRDALQDSGDFAGGSAVQHAIFLLDDRTKDIATARAAFLLSPHSIGTLEARLHAVAAEAAAAQRTMADVASALNAVSSILQLLKNLIGFLA